jgi:hypothetical protein
MKSIRQILMHRHQAAEPKLDALRQNVLLDLATPGRAKHPDRASLRERPAFPGWRDFILSLRWHLTGLGAAWLVVVLLNADRAPTPSTQLARQRGPNPQQILLSLHENRRQLLEMLGTTPTEPGMPPRRRSECQPTSAIV